MAEGIRKRHSKALSRGGLRAAKKTTLGEAWAAWIKGARHGSIPNRSGDPYKRAALRSYESGMRLRVLPRFAGVRLTDLQRFDLQEFADDLLADGWNPSTIQVTLLPVRARSTAARSRAARSRSTLAVVSSFPSCADDASATRLRQKPRR
jgi:hypothetical protein